MLSYQMDITERSRWLITTPNDLTKKLPFYLNEIGHFMCNRGYFTERKGQRNYFLMYTVSGCGYLKYKDKEYLLPPNTAALIYCNHYQYYKTSGEDQWNYRWVHFNGSSAKTYLDLLNGEALSVITMSEPKEFEQICENLTDCLNRNDISSNTQAALLLTQLLTKCVASKLTTQTDRTGQQYNEAIENIINYINTNYHKKISLEELSGMIHVSKYYFLKLFKAYSGFTPYEYLINQRISRAKQLLKSTDLTIGGVSANVGFKDESSFIKQFKRATGYTPLNYRRYI